MSEAQIKSMVDRFLTWKLPADFAPDGGITFTPEFNTHTAHPGRHEPSGTNLLNAVQAEAMVRHMLASAVLYPTLKPLPAAYAWLAEKPGLSRILIEGLALFGLTETPGPANTPMIMALAKEVGLEKSYPSDATAWCGLFLAAIAKRAGWEVVGGPLWARNWANFGRKVEEADAALGDVLVFSRESGGHVGLYVGEDAGYFHVLGGNQSDAVTITRIAKGRLLAVRRPKWKTAQPAGVVKVHLKASGAISENEA